VIGLNGPSKKSRNKKWSRKRRPGWTEGLHENKQYIGPWNRALNVESSEENMTSAPTFNRADGPITRRGGDNRRKENKVTAIQNKRGGYLTRQSKKIRRKRKRWKKKSWLDRENRKKVLGKRGNKVSKKPTFWPWGSGPTRQQGKWTAHGPRNVANRGRRPLPSCSARIKAHGGRPEGKHKKGIQKPEVEKEKGRLTNIEKGA